MTQQKEGIIRARKLIDQKIASGYTAYGMNTLFGHNDNVNVVDPEDFKTLLKQHLVGSPEELNPLLVKSILEVKISQLEQAEMGISVENYDAVVEIYEQEKFTGWDGAIHHSYGAGSVVPGAWIAHNLSQLGVDITVPGDLMAIINGDYISVGLAKYLVSEYEKLVMKACFFVDGIHQQVQYTTVQAPVSCRDSAPLLDACHDSIENLNKAIDNAMKKSSGNPLYICDKKAEDVSIVSNSSFLNYELLFALNNAVSTSKIAMAYLLGAYRYAVETSENHSADAIVQPQKVISSLNMKGLNFPGSFGIVESSGVEDICDRTVESALLFQRTISDLKEALNIVESFPV